MTDEGKSEVAETPEPWAPEGAAKIGTGPRADRDGERGTSVHDETRPSDERGPLPGVENYANDPNVSTAPTHSGRDAQARESASKAG